MKTNVWCNWVYIVICIIMSWGVVNCARWHEMVPLANIYARWQNNLSSRSTNKYIYKQKILKQKIDFLNTG